MDIIRIYEMKLPNSLSELKCGYLGRYLDSEEKNQFERYKVENKKIEFLAGRMLAKGIIGQSLGISIDQVRFYKNRYGKLFVKNHQDTPQLYFNLSHTEGMVVCAFGFIENIGIDIERSQSDHLEIMPKVFVSEESRFVASASTYEERLKRFYRLWTRKEAVMKAIGCGFSLDPLSFNVPLADGRTENESFTFLTYSPSKDYLVSVAVQIEKGRIFKYLTKRIKWEYVIYGL